MTQLVDAKTYDQTGDSFPSIAIDQLSIGEQLVIWAFRNRLAKGSDKVLARGFHVAFGLSAVEAALASFQRLYDTIFHHCCRDLGFHGTRCRCVSSDEIMIVSLIATHHTGMTAQAEVIGRYLVQAAAVDDLLVHAASLSFLMQRHDLRLPLRPLVTYGEDLPGRLH